MYNLRQLGLWILLVMDWKNVFLFREIKELKAIRNAFWCISIWWSFRSKSMPCLINDQISIKNFKNDKINTQPEAINN